MSKVTAQTALPETSIFGHQPADWVVDRIRDHLDSVVGGEWGDDPDAHDEGTLIPVIRVADIRGLDIATEGLTVRRVRDSKLSGRIIGPRTVLLEKSGGGEQTPVGRAVRCRLLTVDAICSNFMAKLDCSPTLDPSYLVYLFDALYTSGVNGACIQPFDRQSIIHGFNSRAWRISSMKAFTSRCFIFMAALFKMSRHYAAMNAPWEPGQRRAASSFRSFI